MFTLSLLIFLFTGLAALVGGAIFIVKFIVGKWKEYDFTSFIKDEWNK